MATARTIAAFWRWFATVAERLDQSFTQPDLIAALEERVGKLGPVAWELGPGVRAANAFVISPDGDPDAIPLAAKVIAAAPAMRGWEFHAWKLAKPYGEAIIVDGKEIRVAGWRYLLRRYPDGLFDIAILAPNLRRARLARRRLAGKIMLDALLGEERRLAAIATYDVILRKGREDARSPTSRLRHLAQHLDHLAATA
jgi:hypothetical protein